MIIVDSNTVIACLTSGKKLPSELVVPDDLYDEYQVAETRHGKKLKGVIQASEIKGFDTAYYVRQYAALLNEYPDLSFEKSRGFADVAIAALVDCLVTDFGKKPPQISLDLGSDTPSIVTVATDDGTLRKLLSKHFEKQISIIGYADL